MRNIRGLFEQWNQLKKMCKDISKEIAPLCNNENEKNLSLIKKLEEDLKGFYAELKRRPFFQYNTGVEKSLELISSVFDEMTAYEEKIADYGYIAEKFGSPDIMQPSIKQVEQIKVELENMKIFWEHTGKMQELYEGYMNSKWIETSPFDMEEDVKALNKQVKEMKVDKKCNAYLGIIEETKKWLVFLPLISELRDEAMRPRHWQAIKDKVQKEFEVNDSLLLLDVFNLNLNKY